MASRKALQLDLRRVQHRIFQMETKQLEMEHTGADLSNADMLHLLNLRLRKAQLDLTLFSARNIEGDEI